MERLFFLVFVIAMISWGVPAVHQAWKQDSQTAAREEIRCYLEECGFSPPPWTYQEGKLIMEIVCDRRIYEDRIPYFSDSLLDLE